MKCAKIIIKDNYEQRGDLVLRSYIRALKKAKANLLLDGNNGIIYGVVDEAGDFCEIFTSRVIDYDDYVTISPQEDIEFCKEISILSQEEMLLLKNIIENVLFNQNNELGFEVSSMEDLAKDRAIEFDAYDNFMSLINPYQRLNENDVQRYNDYNNFLRKIEEIKVMKKNDCLQPEVDEYEILENPKKLVRK